MPHMLDAGAQTEVRALNREMLYACSRAIEGAASGDDFKMPLVPGAPLSPSISVAEETEAEAEAGTKAKAKAKTKTKRAVVDKGKADVVENGVQAAANGKKKRKSIKSGDDSTEIAPKGEGLPVVAEHSKGEHLSRPVENGKLDEDTYEVQKMDKMVKKKKNKKKKKKLSLDSDSEPGNLIKAPPPEEGLTPIQSPSRPGESTAKKNVRFSLKRNLVMTIGQPPLPEDIRTPPTAKPRGPALKRVSSVAENSPPVRIMKMTSPKSETRSPIMTRSAMKAKKSLNVSFSTSPKRNRGKQSR